MGASMLSPAPTIRSRTTIRGPAPLKALIDAEAAAFAVSRQSSIVSKGNPILLNPQAYSTMALVIHELVTNSTKYGSLSGEGEVHIEWSRDDAGDLVLILARDRRT